MEDRVSTGGALSTVGFALAAAGPALVAGAASQAFAGSLADHSLDSAPAGNENVSLLPGTDPATRAAAFLPNPQGCAGEAASGFWVTQGPTTREADAPPVPLPLPDAGADTPRDTGTPSLDQPPGADFFVLPEPWPASAAGAHSDPGGGGAGLGGGGGGGGGAGGGASNAAPNSTPGLPQAAGAAPFAAAADSSAANTAALVRAAEGSPPAAPSQALLPAVSQALAGMAMPIGRRAAPLDGPGGGGGPNSDTHPYYHAPEGSGPVEAVCQFTDTGTGPYAAQIYWDGQSSAGTVVLHTAGFPNLYDVYGAHTFTEEGAYGISVVITGLANGGQIVASGTAAIDDAALTATPITISAVEDSPYPGVLGSFTDANLYATAADFTVSPSFQVVAGSQPGTFNVIGTENWVEEDTYALHIPVTDDGGSTVTTSAQVQVSDAFLGSAPNNSALFEGETRDRIVATLTDQAPDDTTAVISAGTKSLTTGENFPTTVQALGGGLYAVHAQLHYTEEMTDTLLVTASDDGGSIAPNVMPTVTVYDASLSWTSGSPTFTWSQTVHPAPHLIGPSSLTSAEGATVAVQVVANDPDGDALQYDALNLPPGLAIDHTSGLITGTIDYSDAEHFGGDYQATLVVVDERGASASIPLDWTIIDTNRAPVVTSLGDQPNVRGDTVDLHINASDADNDQLFYNASNLPPGLSIDALSGEITGTIDPAQDYSMPYAVTVTASDASFTESQTFNWTVSNTNHAPVLTSPGDQVNVGGDPVEVNLSATDADRQALTYFANNLPSGLSIDPATGVVSGTIAPTAASSTPHAVTVTTSDGMAHSSQTFNWTVTYVGVQAPGDQANTTGDTVSLPIAATSATGTALAYTASHLPVGLSIDSTTGVISGTIGTAADAGSPYPVTVTASDGSHQASTTFAWTVLHLALTNPGDQTGSERASVSLQIQATDADHDTLAYTATGLPAGLSINASTGLISGTPAAGAALGGPYHVLVGVSDGSHSVSVPFTWAVTPAVVLIPISAQTNVLGDTVAMQVRARNAVGTVLGYAAGPLPPGLSIDNLTGLISGTITSGSGNSYTVNVVASGGIYGSLVTFTWTVAPVLVVNPGDQASTTGDTVSLPISARDGAGLTLSYASTGLPPGLSINANTGQISGTISATADGDSPYTATVTASDGSHSASQTFSWAVDQHVTFDRVADQANATGATVSLSVSGSDGDGDTLSYSASGLPSGLAIGSASGTISGTIAAGADGTSPYTVTVTASDGSRSASQTFHWTVSHVGLANPGDPTSADGHTVSLALQGEDPDTDSVTYSATGLPPGLALNAATGVISGTLTATAHAQSPYTVTATASDGTHSASQTFVWTVTEVGLANPGNRTDTEGASVSLSITPTTSNGQALSYSASGLPVGLAIDAQTGLISGTLAAGAAGFGPYSVTVAASDGTQASNQTFTWTVNPRVVFPTTPADQSNAEGDSVSLSVAASEAGGAPLTYSADGLPAGLNINASTGIISGTVAAGASTGGSRTVTVWATDGTYSGNVVFGWAIPHAEGAGPLLSNPGHQTNTETDLVRLPVVATDADGDPLTFSVSGLPAGLEIDPSSGLISGTVDFAAAGYGPYSVTVSVDDGNGGRASQALVWAVRPATITAQGLDVSAVEGTPIAAGPVATFTDPNWERTAGDFASTINWGDGTSDPGLVSGAQGSFTVTGAHTYILPGSYTVTVQVGDAEGASATTTATATVAMAPFSATGGLHLTDLAGQGQIFTLGSVTDTDPGDAIGNYAVAVDWHDGPGGSSDVTAGTLIEQVNGTFIITGTHTFLNDGNYTVTATVTEPEGSTATAISSVLVGDLWAGAPAELTVASFADANPYATIADYTVTVAWGDGTTGPGWVIAGDNGFIVKALHSYAEEGSYSPSVTITDDGGSMLAGTDTNPILVVRPLITPHAAPLAPTADLTFSNVEVADFTDPNPFDTADEFAARISWGDGTTSHVTVSGATGLFRVFGSHTYAQAGVWPVLVAIEWEGQDVALADKPAEAGKGAPALSLRSLTFEDGYVLQQDTGNPYSAPQWTKGGDSAPYVYVRDMQLHVKASFDTKLAVGTTLDIRGEVIDPSQQGALSLRPRLLGTFKVVGAAVTDKGRLSIDQVLPDFKFPNEVYYYNPLAINWSFSTDGKVWTDATKTWTAAGSSSNEIYVTYAKPDVPKGPPLRTLVDVGCRSAIDQNKPMPILEAIWAKYFAGPAGGGTPSAKRADGEALSYYSPWKQWGKAGDPWPAGNARDLIITKDGMCGAWADFLYQTLQAQGLSPKSMNVNLVKITAKRETGFLINGWKTKGEKKTWVNNIHIVKDFGAGEVPFTADKSYAWRDAPRDREFEFSTKDSLPGQNNATPPAAFSNHVVIQIAGGDIYDPSYGAHYQNLLKFYDAALFGFYRLDLAPGGTFRTMTIRMKDPLPEGAGALAQVNADLNTQIER